MKIAVTYEDGNVFQHFGRTENFKIYEVEDGRVISSEVMNSNGVGHEALAWLLKDSSIDVLICGGMGQGAQDALAEAGIEVCAGAEGNTDEAVAAYLAGELVNTGVNCDHHDHEHGHHHDHDHDHGCGEGDGCSPQDCAGCAGCGGGNFEPFYMFEGTNVGKRVKVHYRGTLDDGTQFDASYDRNQPLEFICGVGQMISGFDRAVAEMSVGDIIDVHLEPEEAYGMPNPNMIVTVKRAAVQGLDGIEEGDKVMLQDELGRPFDALVTFLDDEDITFDCNHEMAGKALNFTIEMLEIN
ncbi:MAG: FKBP-type peptidyl-prolyl cis-trans isomerase [Mogibacterium sp.]|nr:FKBP-type peptidyl-prolyl cis-trans isomerase [Mogibacterium sp.]